MGNPVWENKKKDIK